MGGRTGGKGRSGGKGRKGRTTQIGHKCSKCDFVAKTKGGLTRHKKAKH
jgi:hypothetical protein